LISLGPDELKVNIDGIGEDVIDEGDSDASVGLRIRSWKSFHSTQP
jgi:hypothetical protein